MKNVCESGAMMAELVKVTFAFILIITVISVVAFFSKESDWKNI